MKAIAAAPLSDTKKRINGDLYRFHVCQHDQKLNIWELQLLHLREKMLPGIADENGYYELIELEDGKYPAESTTAIYDEDHHTLYFQRNFYGMSIRTLEIYIQELAPKGTLLVFKPRMLGNRLSKVTDTSLYRRVILISGTEQIDQGGGTSLNKALRSFASYQGKIVKIELGFGHSSGLLKSDATAELIRDAYASKEIKKLEVTMSDPDDISFETINLLDDRAKYSTILEVSRENPITHSRLYQACFLAYKDQYSK